MNVIYAGIEYRAALITAGVDTLRSRRARGTHSAFYQPTRAGRDVLSSLPAAAKERREHYCKTMEN